MTTYRYQPELDVLQEAQLAAVTETKRYLDDHPGQWYPCGFAWVKIRPARGRFVEMCKDQEAGWTDDFNGGFVIYNPSGNSTQSMEAKAAGARAFLDVLKRHYPKMNAFVETRMD